MRVGIAAVFAFLALLLVAAGCGGQQQGSSGENKAQGGTTKQAEKGVRGVKGEVGNVNAERRTFSVKSEGGQEVSFRYNKGLRVKTESGQDGTVEDIKAGDRVTVRYTKNEKDENVARTVKVGGGAGGGTTG